MSDFILSDFVIEKHPTVTRLDFRDKINLQDDSNGEGAYIKEWNFNEPMHPDLETYLN